MIYTNILALNLRIFLGHTHSFFSRKKKKKNSKQYLFSNRITLKPVKSIFGRIDSVLFLFYFPCVQLGMTELTEAKWSESEDLFVFKQHQFWTKADTKRVRVPVFQKEHTHRGALDKTRLAIPQSAPALFVVVLALCDCYGLSDERRKRGHEWVFETRSCQFVSLSIRGQCILQKRINMLTYLCYSYHIVLRS